MIDRLLNCTHSVSRYCRHAARSTTILSLRWSPRCGCRCCRTCWTWSSGTCTRTEMRRWRYTPRTNRRSSSRTSWRRRQVSPRAGFCLKKPGNKKIQSFHFLYRALNAGDLIIIYGLEAIFPTDVTEHLLNPEIMSKSWDESAKFSKLSLSLSLSAYLCKSGVGLATAMLELRLLDDVGDFGPSRDVPCPCDPPVKDAWWERTSTSLLRRWNALLLHRRVRPSVLIGSTFLYRSVRRGFSKCAQRVKAGL